MLGSLSPPHRAGTFALLALAAALAAGAVLVGINDNPPGIALAALAGAMLVVGLVHHWRAPRRFLVLAGASVGCVLLSVAVFIGIDISVSSGYLRGPAGAVLERFGEALALAVAFVGLPSILVGLFGGLVTWVTTWRK